MKRSIAPWAALLLAGCGFPYTPRALPSLNAPAADAAPAGAAYLPPRQLELAVAGQPLSIGRHMATAPLPGALPGSRTDGNTTSSRPVPDQ